MSGVIDADGTQWEHCNVCGEFVRIQDLLYERPSERFKHGRDIGPCCVDLDSEQQDRLAERATRRAIVEIMLQSELQGYKPVLHKDGGISRQGTPNEVRPLEAIRQTRDRCDAMDDDEIARRYDAYMEHAV